MTTKYTFEFPAGGRIKARVLDWDTVQTLREQCNPREILKLVAAGGDGEEYFLTEQDTSILGAFRSASCPFLNDKKQAPAPAVYKVVLKESADDMISIAMCGSFVEWLGRSNTCELAREYCGDRLQYYSVTSPNADAKYSIAVMCNTIVLTLDFTQHTDKMLAVELPVNLISSATSTSGAISGTLFIMAQILPYSILFDMVATYKVKCVLLTGEGLSGSVAHAAAILFRELFRTAEAPPSVKAVSFSGPLCGSPSLHEHLAATGQKENHTTVNCGGVALDRLIADYQRMSPLAGTEARLWTLVYESISGSLRSFLDSAGGRAVIDIPALRQAEDNLRHHLSMLSGESALLPIGRYLLRKGGGGGENVIESEGNLLDVLVALESSQHLVWSHHFSLRDVDVRSLPTPSFQVPPEAFVPRITAVSMIQTPRRLTFNFEGKYLDSVQMRLLESDIAITSVAEFAQLPLTVPSDCVSILPAARMLSVRCFPDKTIIDVVGVSLRGPGTLSLKTDFGETNVLPFTDDSTVQGQESTPSKSLHPTMNAEFLSGAFLRVAICCKMCGGRDNLPARNRGMAELLDLLLSIEGDLHGFTDNKLNNILGQFMEDRVDVGMLRNMCLPRFEEMSRIATEPVKVEETFVYKGVRKVTGYAAQAVGGLITFAGILLSIPALILALPVVNVVNRVMQSEGTPTLSMGTAMYAGFVGLMGLPGMIVAAFGLFVVGAGAYANRDIPSHRYKQVLGNIITGLGGNPLEVVDELPQVEEYVVSRMGTLYPQLVLSQCSMEELVSAINQSIDEATQKGNEEVATIGKRLKSNRQVLMKLRLIGRIHGVRQLLRSHLMIGFVGVHNAGKSTSIERLFGVNAHSSMIERTERVNAYCIGEWMDRVAQERVSFMEWLHSKRRNDLQLYAVDFPGITDEREEIGSLTRYSAELASMFVVVVTAGHVAAPEKEAVLIAKAHHKPFIVIVNRADTIAHELKKPANEERIRQDYANTLGVPPELVHFMNALDPYCNDKLRGILFGLLQTLIGDPDVVFALALRMVPPAVVADIDDELFGVPDTLAAAAYSLMFNLCSMRSSTLTATCAALLRDSNEERDRAEATSDLRTVTFAVGDILRQVALSLNISPQSYENFAKLIHRRSIPFKVTLDQVGRSTSTELTDDTKRHLEMLVTTLALSAIREQIYGYFEKPVPCATSNFAALSLEVLVDLQLICSQWMEIGFQRAAVERTCVELFGGSDPVNSSLFLQKVSVAQTTNSILSEDGVESKSDDSRRMEAPAMVQNVPFMRQDMLGLEDVELEFDFAEINRYTRGRDQLAMLHTITFEPTEVSKVAGETSESDESADELTRFKDKMTDYAKNNLTKVALLRVPSPDGDQKILPALLAAFAGLSVEQLTTYDIRFQVENDIAVDVNGVTKSVITKAAQELDSNPSTVYMVKDTTSGLIYPNPYMCIGLRTEHNSAPHPDDPSIATVLGTYRALGRLLGFVAVKHVVGVTFPVNFSLSVYRVLLGRCIGLRDLEIVDPSLIRNMKCLCTSKDQDLELCFEMTMTVTERDEETSEEKIVRSRSFQLCPNGQNKEVTSENVMEYLRDYMKIKLCCTDRKKTENVWLELLLGMQHSCPREMFSTLSPEALQLVIQGCLRIEVEQWMQYTSMPNVNGSTADLTSWFWSVVLEMSDLEKVKLLVFTTGNAALPANGFQDLDPQFTLLVDPTADVNSLPRASVCFNRLYLPCYPTEERLRQKLLFAICNTDSATLGHT